MHRLVDQIKKDFKAKRYCTAVFLNVFQASDKVWYKELHVKLNKFLPYPYFQLLKSYLSDRHFLVKQRSDYTNLYPIYSDVTQGSVLRPILYFLCTADLPTTRLTTVAMLQYLYSLEVKKNPDNRHPIIKKYL